MERKGLGKTYNPQNNACLAFQDTHSSSSRKWSRLKHHLSTLQTHPWAATCRNAWIGCCCPENPLPSLPSMSWPKSKGQTKQPAPFAHTHDQQSTIRQFARAETISNAIHVGKNERNSRLSERELPHCWWVTCHLQVQILRCGLPCRAVTSRSLCAGKGTCQCKASTDPLALP